MKSMLHRCFMVFLVLAATLPAAEGGTDYGPTPLVAMWQTSPRAYPLADFPATNAPRAVVYEDGTTISLVFPAQAETEIFRRALAEPLYTTTKISSGALGSWYEDLLAVTGMDDMPREFVLDPARAESVVWFAFFAGGSTVTVTVRGLDESSLDRFGTPRSTDAGYVPPRLLRLYQHLRRLSDAQAGEWRPRFIAVEFQPAPANRHPTIAWPPAWAASASAHQSGDGERISVVLDGSIRDRLAALLPAPLSQHAVRIEGRTMTVNYRVVFPGERAWLSLWASQVARLTQPETPPSRDAEAVQQERDAFREEFRQTPNQAVLPK